MGVRGQVVNLKQQEMRKGSWPAYYTIKKAGDDLNIRFSTCGHIRLDYGSYGCHDSGRSGSQGALGCQKQCLPACLSNNLESWTHGMHCHQCTGGNVVCWRSRMVGCCEARGRRRRAPLHVHLPSEVKWIHDRVWVYLYSVGNVFPSHSCKNGVNAPISLLAKWQQPDDTHCSKLATVSPRRSCTRSGVFSRFRNYPATPS